MINVTTGMNDAGHMVPIEWLQTAFKMRAAAYANMFDVLRDAFGVERAVELLSEATRRMGETAGGQFADLGPDKLVALKERFLGGIPAGDILFKPEVRRCDDERLEIKFHRCPLKEAWQAMGRSDEDLELLCKAGGAIDGGLFKAAGFVFKGETWKVGEEGCCRLIVEKG
jgi:hypothetical protein